MACPRCGAASRPGAEFCDTCGARLAAPGRGRPSTPPKSCSQCGNPNVAGGWVCQACGASLAPGGAGSGAPADVTAQLAVGSWFFGLVITGIVGSVGAIWLFLMGLREASVLSGVVAATGWIGAALVAKHAL